MLRFITATIVGLASLLPNQDAPAAKQPAVVELFEDDAEGLLKLLTNPGDAPGRGQSEATGVFSGKACIKITDYQRYQRTLPGWNHAIREKPKAGEYRYLRFAWKTEGSTCLMLQLHDATDWHLRYTAGPNPYGWMTQFVADKPPALWTVVTVDLFKDFGERTIKGMALTIHGGAGYFDHIYLGRTIDDLDRIDADGLAEKEVAPNPQSLNRLWQELTAQDAAIRYRAFWTLVAGRDTSVAFIKQKLSPVKSVDPDRKQIDAWIRLLNSGNFVERAGATAELKKRIELVLPILKVKLMDDPPLEMRRRIEALIAEAPPRDGDRIRAELAQRILEYAVANKKKS